MEDTDERRNAVIAEWVDQARAPSAAVALGGSDRSFLAEVIGRAERRVRVLCDRTYAQTVAALANDMFKNPPAIQFITRLDRDLEQLVEVDSRTPLVVPFHTLGQFIISHCTRLQREAGMLSDYEVPESVVVRPLVAVLRDRIANIAKWGRTPLIIHDGNGAYLTEVDEPTSLFLNFDEGSVPDLNNIDVLRRGGRRKMLPEDLVPSVLAHGKFLMKTDPDDLGTMHKLSTSPEVREAIADYWKGNLEQLIGRLTETDGDDLEDMKYALAKLKKAMAA